MICLGKECTRRAVKRNMCCKHYTRWHRHGDPNYTAIEMHGLFNTPEYGMWLGMKDRCYNQNCKMFYLYGGRGIKLCDEWRKSFSAFIADVGLRPGPGYSIDRINSDGDYEPGNVRWATPVQQANNRRTNLYIAYRGNTQSLSDWCRELCLDYEVIWTRIHKLGWSNERAFETLIRKRG